MVRASLRINHFSLPSLSLYQVPQLPLHSLERIVYHFSQRLVCSVVHLLFLCHQLVPRRDGDIDAHTKLISFLVGMIGLLDCHVATADMIAKLVQARGLGAHHLFNPIALVESAVSDIHWQLHIGHTLRAVVMPAQGDLACDRIVISKIKTNSALLSAMAYARRLSFYRRINE